MMGFFPNRFFDYHKYLYYLGSYSSAVGNGIVVRYVFSAKIG